MTPHLAVLKADTFRTEIHIPCWESWILDVFNLKNAVLFYDITDMLRFISTNANASHIKTNDVQD